jgi:hypothetical protein
MVDMKTKELPLVSTDNVQTAQVPQMSVAAAAQTTKLGPEPVALPPSAHELPSPFSNSTGELRAVQATPQVTPFPLPSVTAPPPFEPAAMYPATPAAQAPVVAAPAARRPRRWPLAVASWVGGVVAGMLILMLGLAFLGGPRDVVVNNGDPTAAWDSSITLTDAYLTAQARKGGTAQVQEPTMHVQADGTIAMQGKASLFGRSVPVSGKLQPALVEGKLEMQIISLDLGGINLPSIIVNQIQGSMASAAQPPAAAISTTIVKLEASEGKLVIYSKLK